MPLAYPLGAGQPLGCKICGPVDAFSPLVIGLAARVGPVDVLTRRSPSLETSLRGVKRRSNPAFFSKMDCFAALAMTVYSAAMPDEPAPACAICRNVKRFSLPVSVFGNCTTNSIARGYL